MPGGRFVDFKHFIKNSLPFFIAGVAKKLQL